MILDKIIEKKKQSLELIKRVSNIDILADKIDKLPKALDFLSESSGIKVIAEIKKASPSKGIIRQEFDPVSIALSYQSNGASAISVLTETDFFLGSSDYLKTVKNNVSIPVLRKDFIFDIYQIYETRAIGADAVLLIVACLDLKLLKELYAKAVDLGLCCLVEVHTFEELQTALKINPEIIGINNRNLNTFTTNIDTTLGLIKHIPEGIKVVSESGISKKEDIIKLQNAGVDAFLIGETLMKENDPGDILSKLIG